MAHDAHELVARRHRVVGASAFGGEVLVRFLALDGQEGDVFGADFRAVLESARPYLGSLVGAYTDWTPLAGRGELFPQDLDRHDPWQFKNFRVT